MRVTIRRSPWTIAVLALLAGGAVTAQEAEPWQEPRAEIEPIKTSNDKAATMWELDAALKILPASFKSAVRRVWQDSFTVGRIDAAGRCSGAMISPHVFMTAAHCGGSEWPGRVWFFHIDEDASAPGAAAQTLSPVYQARAFPSTSFGDTTDGGDTMLWWLDDDAAGVPPGIRYGYLELSEKPVAKTDWAYSFWVNPLESFKGAPLGDTLLYSSGQVTGRRDDDFIGPTTDFAIYGAPGASGSAVLGLGSHGGRVIGVTSCAPKTEGNSRCTAETEHLLEYFDAGAREDKNRKYRNQVHDAVEHDWLTIGFAPDFQWLGFDTPTRRALWRRALIPSTPGGDIVRDVPDGVFVDGRWVAKVVGGLGGGTDGLWHGGAHFRPSGTYRVTLLARGVVAGQSSYVKFQSDRGGPPATFTFQPGSSYAWHTGRVTLDDWPDYRLVLGTNAGGTVYVAEVAVVREEGRFDFETGAERRAWDFLGNSHPTSWGIGGAGDFSGVLVGPCSGGCLRNRYLALRPGKTYDLRFTVQHVSGALGSVLVGMQNASGGLISSQVVKFTSAGQKVDTATLVTGSSTGRLVFTTRDAMTYMVDAIELTE